MVIFQNRCRILFVYCLTRATSEQSYKISGRGDSWYFIILILIFFVFFSVLKRTLYFFSTYLHDENFYLIFEFLLIITRKISAAGGWAPLRCSLQSVPPPAADNQGVWGSEGGGGGGWPRPGPLLSSSSSCHFHVSLLCSSSLTEYTFLFSPFSLHMPLSCFRASIRVLFSRCFRLPTTCEGDGAAAWLYESRPRRYFAFGVHFYYPYRLSFFSFFYETWRK